MAETTSGRAAGGRAAGGRAVGGREEPGGARPLVSLLVLGFNQERHTREVVEAAFAQTYEPLEIVLSDDCSADRTFEIMREMADAYRGPHRVVLSRNERNRGIVGNVNALMASSRGALVVKNDGDDLSEPHRVERIVREWLDGGRRDDLLFSAVTRIDEEGRPLGVLRLADEGQLSMRLLVEEPTPWNVVSRNLFALGACIAWTRAVFDAFGPIDEAAVVEDAVIPFRASVLGGIAYIDEPLVRYRVGGLTTLDEGSGIGHDKMYGRRIKLNRIQMQSKRAILSDLDRVGFPDRDRCRANCLDTIAKQEHLLAMVEMGRAERLMRLPSSALLSLRRRSPFYAYINVKYVLDRLSMRITDIRGARRAAARARRRGS